MSHRSFVRRRALNGSGSTPPAPGRRPSIREVDFLTALHTSTPRDYVGRVLEHDKAACAEVAKRWGPEYWDGERQFGYGGYRYDGRWFPVARAIADHYGLREGDRVLDVGCGKAFLLYELTHAVPGIEVVGVDVSEYGIRQARPEVRGRLEQASATALPFSDSEFDLVLSLNTLHNLQAHELDAAFAEIQRVGRCQRYVAVESFRNEREKANLLYWQLTCESFHRPEGWKWLAAKAGYRGDLGFIYFE